MKPSSAIKRYELSAPPVGVLSHHATRDEAFFAAARYAKQHEVSVTMFDRMARRGAICRWLVHGPLKEMLSNQTTPVNATAIEWRKL